MSYYRRHIKENFVAFSDEDPERVEQLIVKARQDADWVVQKVWVLIQSYLFLVYWSCAFCFLSVPGAMGTGSCEWIAKNGGGRIYGAGALSHLSDPYWWEWTDKPVLLRARCSE